MLVLLACWILGALLLYFVWPSLWSGRIMGVLAGRLILFGAIAALVYGGYVLFGGYLAIRMLAYS